jgi:di/tricarboxylate transporter
MPADFHTYFVLALIGVALLLFANERIPIATTSLLILVVLTLVFEWLPYTEGGAQVHSYEFLTGFGHRALIAVCALMIAGQGLINTGALEPLGRVLARYWINSPGLLFLITMLVAGGLSAFVNNTPIVILLLPILISVSIKTATPASGLLMPIGFATLVGGMSTTIGTSTNLLVVSFAEELGVRAIGMFDFLVPALMAGSVGILYLWLIAPRIMPLREPLLPGTSPRVFDAQLRITREGFADGKTLAEALERTEGRLEIKAVVRGEEGARLAPLPDVRLRPDDRLIVRDTPEHLIEFEQLLDARLYSHDQPVDESHPLNDNNQQIAEIVVVGGSTLEGMTLANARFTDRYQLLVLALHRATRLRGPARNAKHSEDIALRSGDIILVQGSRDSIKRLKASRNVLVLDASVDLPRTSRALLSLSIMAFIVATAASGLLPIETSAMTGVLLMLLTGCLRWSDATRALSTPVILIIVTSLAMGNALLQTGGDELLARFYLDLTSGWSATAVLSGLMVLMAILTNVVSNNAAAVIGTPIAISIANQLGLNPEPFVLAVIFGANMSFATPMSYQTNLLVMNAGNYRFMDFVRIGLPLSILLWASFTFILPWLYDL